MLRKRLTILAAGAALAVLGGLAVTAPAMASPAAHTAPVHAAAKAGPLTSGYCVVNGYGWYVTSPGAGDIMTSNGTCTTDIAWAEQSNGTYEMKVNNGSGCVNTDGAHAWDNSCQANFSPEEWIPRLQSDGRYLLENVHWALYLAGIGNGQEMILTGADNGESEWTW
jgi:hypothetical protein